MQGSDGYNQDHLTEELYRGSIKDEYGVRYAADIDITDRLPKTNGHLIRTIRTCYHSSPMAFFM